MKTIVGLYDNMHDAEEVITDLVQAGFDRSDISLMAADRWADDVGAATSTGATVVGATQGGAVMAGPGAMSGANGTTMTPDDDIVAPTGDQLVSDVTTGAVTGVVVGGLTGVLLGLGVLAIPGFGPVLAAGPLVAGLAGAGLGAAVGGLVGALVSWGVPPEEAELYAESVRRGSILVGVKTPDERAQQAVNVMNNHGPVDVERRSEYWRSSGWAGYDPDAPAWSDAEVDSDRRTYNNYLDYSAYAPAFREHYQTTYGNMGRGYTYYDPAYRYGYNLAMDERYRDIDTWDEMEADARASWEKGESAVQGAWDDFKDAVRHAWEDVKDALDIEADYAGREERYRSHYETLYRNTLRDYSWYEPAYRHGYIMGMDERYDDFDTWEEAEAQAREDWEQNHPASEGGATATAWEEIKEAVRQGWDSVREAFDIDDDVAVPPGTGGPDGYFRPSNG